MKLRGHAQHRSRGCWIIDPMYARGLDLKMQVDAHVVVIDDTGELDMTVA